MTPHPTIYTTRATLGDLQRWSPAFHADGGLCMKKTKDGDWVSRFDLVSLAPASVRDAARLRALASGLQWLATDLRGGEDEAAELLGEVITTLRALAEGA